MGHSFSCIWCFDDSEPTWQDVQRTTYVTSDDSDTIDMLLFCASDYDDSERYVYKNTVAGIKRLIRKYRKIQPLLHSSAIVPHKRIAVLEQNLRPRCHRAFTSVGSYPCL